MMHSRCVRALAVLIHCAFAVGLGAQQPLDVLLINGRVLDGAGNPWVRQDVGIRGDRIAFLGLAFRDKPVARDTVDISGKYLAPGFIDMHSHAEFENARDRAAVPILTQGITTVLVGIDGSGNNRIAEQVNA